MGIPKYGMIDLHVHLDGSLSFKMAGELAKMQGMETKSARDLKSLMVAPKDCRDLNDYLTKFEYPLELLQTESAITYSVYELLKIQKSQGIAYSEIRFAPQLHTRRGLKQEQVVAAAVKGLQEFMADNKMAGDKTENGKSEGCEDFCSGLILCCMRGADNQVMNMETIDVAGEFLGKGVVALDLAGAEALFPTENFESLFREARRKGIPFTIHAGEADGPESIWQALEFGASRIGHGVRCLEDRELVRRLAKDKIPLELCPTSNINTRIFKNITDYPILQLLDEGIKITINTDNMTVSNTTLRDEFKLVSDTFQLREMQIRQLMRNAADSAFLHIQQGN